MVVTTARVSLLPFAPFALVSVAHLVGLFFDLIPLSHATKPLLMPALVIALLYSVRPRITVVVVTTCVAVALSWFGDLLLTIPGGIGFLLGLGSFFLAHVAYLTLFARRLRIRRVPPAALAFVVWWVALLIALAPHLGALLVPVALYGLALGASASFGLACNRFVAAGAATFLVSDTLLAFKFFYPAFSLWQLDALIMLLYCAGQGLIVYGVIRSVAVVPVVREPIAAIA